MARIDMPLAELREYRPVVAVPDDFDEFWARSLDEARAVGDDASVRRIDTPLRGIDVHDVRYAGFGNAPIAAWLLVPEGAESAPGIVLYHGYGGGRGLPHESLAWPSCGFATLVVDIRGQGGSRPGDTGDPVGSGPGGAGFMTRGIEDAATYYYRRVYVDAVRAVDALRSVPAVDPARITVAGTSQGGGIALAVAGLDHGVAACLADVPFLCHFERSVGFSDRDPYAEIVRYLRARRGAEDDVFRTLSYVDAVSFAARAEAPALFSVGLQDPVCPPSSVFAAYKAYAGPKDIAVYPFNEHAGGGAAHWPRQTRFVDAVVRG